MSWLKAKQVSSAMPGSSSDHQNEIYEDLDLPYREVKEQRRKIQKRESAHALVFVGVLVLLWSFPTVGSAPTNKHQTILDLLHSYSWGALALIFGYASLRLRVTLAGILFSAVSLYTFYPRLTDMLNLWAK
ncbi:MAG: hypothetical protein AAGJ81_12835 [Verrucomicrobiota bacterium]